jgi:hypothetical protein
MIPRWLVRLILIVIGLLVVYMIWGCTLTKKASKSSDTTTGATYRDTIHTHLTDSGGLRVNEWARETIIYPKGDTTIINNYSTPAVIIRESGKQSEAYWLYKTDSMKAAAKDTTSHVVTASQSQSKTRVLGWEQIAIIGLIVVFLIDKVAGRFTITRKSK